MRYPGRMATADKGCVLFSPFAMEGGDLMSIRLLLVAEILGCGFPTSIAVTARVNN